ncbi:MAG TPA: hypothetical protein VGX50_00300 [Longimicrobium sp.]|jgi:hypothetical protein|nr:hypothetical protein [Longimicrobium sp.]
MMPMPILRRSSVVAVLLLGACRGRGGNGDGAVKMDTANAQWEDGMSAEQVQSEAKALSPEEAARMGIAPDTTIHLEQLDSRDTLPGGGAAPTPAPATSGAGAADTMPKPGVPVGSQPQAGNAP